LASVEENVNSTGSLDEDELRKKLSDHFSLLRDFKESEKLRTELDRTTSALQLYEEYKKQKKKTARRGIKIGGKGA
jgi:nucleolar complex protein 3